MRKRNENPMPRSESGRLGGKRRVELRGSPGTTEGCRLGGLTTYRRHPEQILFIRTSESLRKGELAQSREDKIKGAIAACHLRRHVARNKPNFLRCELCIAELQTRSAEQIVAQPAMQSTAA
jgi:hypothetical protein